MSLAVAQAPDLNPLMLELLRPPGEAQVPSWPLLVCVPDPPPEPATHRFRRVPRPSTPDIDDWCAAYAEHRGCTREAARDRLARYPAGCTLIHAMKRERGSPYSLEAARVGVARYLEGHEGAERQGRPRRLPQTRLGAEYHGHSKPSEPASPTN